MRSTPFSVIAAPPPRDDDATFPVAPAFAGRRYGDAGDAARALAVFAGPGASEHFVRDLATTDLSAAERTALLALCRACGAAWAREERSELGIVRTGDTTDPDTWGHVCEEAERCLGEAVLAVFGADLDPSDAPPRDAFWEGHAAAAKRGPVTAPPPPPAGWVACGLVDGYPVRARVVGAEVTLLVVAPPTPGAADRGLSLGDRARLDGQRGELRAAAERALGVWLEDPRAGRWVVLSPRAVAITVPQLGVQPDLVVGGRGPVCFLGVGSLGVRAIDRRAVEALLGERARRAEDDDGIPF